VAAAALALSLLLPSSSPGVTEKAAANRPLVVAIADSPPFAILEPDGSWTGMSLELWRRVADELELPWELHASALEDLDGLLGRREVDLVLGGLAVTPEGEISHDYTQPYHSTGLGFAQLARGGGSWRAALAALASRELLTVLGLIAVGVLVVGIVITLIERRQQSSGDFGGPLHHGVASGIWWAAVTMTTVGYGDKTPKSGPGRAVALLWMFIGVVTVAVFTATVTTMLTVGSLQGIVQRPADLLSLRLGAVGGGPGAEYLARRHARFTPFPRYEDALAALAAGKVDAVVADQPSLRYLAARDHQGVVQVSPIVLEPLSYAIGLPPDSPLRETLNRALLAVLEQDSWIDVERRYLGHP
jgi:ABC-type amino acid transport substrate-binding protein